MITILDLIKNPNNLLDIQLNFLKINFDVIRDIVTSHLLKTKEYEQLKILVNETRDEVEFLLFQYLNKCDSEFLTDQCTYVNLDISYIFREGGDIGLYLNKEVSYLHREDDIYYRLFIKKNNKIPRYLIISDGGIAEILKQYNKLLDNFSNEFSRFFNIIYRSQQNNLRNLIKSITISDKDFIKVLGNLEAINNKDLRLLIFNETFLNKR